MGMTTSRRAPPTTSLQHLSRLSTSGEHRSDSASSSSLTDEGPLTKASADHLLSGCSVEELAVLFPLSKCLEDIKSVRSKFVQQVRLGHKVRRCTDKFLELRAVGFWTMNEALNKKHRMQYRSMVLDSRLREAEELALNTFATTFGGHPHRTMVVLQMVFAASANMFAELPRPLVAKLLCCTYAVLQRNAWPQVFLFRRMLRKLREFEDWSDDDIAFCVSVLAESIDLREEKIDAVLECLTHVHADNKQQKGR